MLALAWLLVRWPNTVTLATIERRLSTELNLRALMATQGRRSPNQFRPPPPDLVWMLVFLLALGAAAYFSR